LPAGPSCGINRLRPQGIQAGARQAALLEHTERHVGRAARQLRPLCELGEGPGTRHLRVVRGAVHLAGHCLCGARYGGPIPAAPLDRAGGTLRPYLLVHGRAPRQLPAGHYLQVPHHQCGATHRRGAGQHRGAWRGMGAGGGGRQGAQPGDAAPVAHALRLRRVARRKGGQRRPPRGRAVPAARGGSIYATTPCCRCRAAWTSTGP